MNYKYILKEVKKANKNAIKAYQRLQYYNSKKDKKCYDYCIWYITEVNEILTNLEISIEIKLRGGKNEQL